MQDPKLTMEPLSIAMVSDFFHPNVGGVENHIYMLSANLLRRGHKVIVITHSHPPSRVGIRHLLPGLKVYHLPFPTLASSATLPNYFTLLPYLRTILLREHVQLVHAHASLSALGQEALLHAHLMGVRTVFTDHSLFGFEDAAGILTNKLLEAALRCVGAVICVSHTGRENTVLRGQLFDRAPSGTMTVRSNVYVIPNALVPDQFRPAPVSNPPAEDNDIITIVVLSRLAYRKGIDLLVAAAPRICARWPNVRFVIGGSGPKLNDLLQMREKYMLQERIELLGSVRHEDVRNVLTRGRIFLNTSLTESFGIAILEAACAGLHVVSTRVGGVPEVLPADMVSFAEPEEDDILRAMSEAIALVSRRAQQHDPLRAHARVRSFYDWAAVAARTEKVYEAVVMAEEMGIWERIGRTMELGRFAGLIYTVILIVDCLFFLVLEWTIPREDLDYVRMGWDSARFEELAKEEEVRLEAEAEAEAGASSARGLVTVGIYSGE